MIKFFCPNRHPLKSADDRAGKPGQCPRCLTEFLVPQVDACSEGEMVVATATGPRHPTESDESPGETEKFMFLCPSGHKLHGSPDQQGRPGQCPHCGTRFLIPTGDEVQEVEIGAAEPDQPDWDGFEEVDADEPLVDLTDPVLVESPDEPPPPPLPVSCHPLAQVIRRLWAETRGAGALEIQLDDNETLVAESFSAELSQHEFGVFAVRGDAKTQAIAIVPWESIARATLRNLADLPTDLFRSTPPPTRRRSDLSR